jgi:hypothetical protein
LILLPEKRKSLGLKPKSQKNIEKIEEMLSELKISQASSSKTITPISQQFSNSDSISFHDSNKKACSVLTKSEEQENLFITLISKIENPELKEEYFKKLKKTMIKKAIKPSKSKISLDETLEKFSKQKSKVATISDLQHEISNINKDIVDLKKDLHNLKIDNKNLEQEFLISRLKNCFQ